MKSKSTQKEKSHKILVIRMGAMGDIILTTPVIRALKNQLPNIELHYCVKKKYESVLEHNPYIDKIISFEKVNSKWTNLSLFSNLVKQIKKEKYDTIIDLHGSLRSKIIKWCHLNTTTKIHRFPGLPILKRWLFIKFKKNVLPKLHVVDRYMEAVKPLSIKKDEGGLDFFISQKATEVMRQFTESYQDRYVAYGIGAQAATRRLPVHKMIELCKVIHEPLLLLGDETDYERGEEIVKAFEGLPKIIFNLCGKYTIHESAVLIQNAQYVITHDSGLMHVSSALKKKLYVIWGSTQKDFGMYPYNTAYKAIQVEGLGCRPCSHLGFQACPKKHFKCMNDLIFSSNTFN